MEGRTFQAKFQGKVTIKCDDLTAEQIYAIERKASALLQEQIEEMDTFGNKFLAMKGGSVRVKNWEFLNLIPKDKPKQEELPN